MKKRMMNKNLNAKNGFTLIELLVTMALLGLLVAAGVPGLQTLFANMAVRTTSENLVNTLAYARGLAVSSVDDIIVCPSTDANNCGGVVDWVTGWIVLDSAGMVLRVVDNAGTNTTITGAPANVGFDRQGETVGAAVGFSVGSTQTGISARQITVSAVGYTSIN